MPYYVRLFSKKIEPVTVSSLQDEFSGKANFDVLSGDDDKDWQKLIMRSADGQDICLVERGICSSDEIAAEEIKEFQEEMEETQPLSAAGWVRQYLSECRAIFAIQVIGGQLQLSGELLTFLHSGPAHGIVFADHEGFSNEEGQQITWDFSDDVEGEWEMAVLNNNGIWQKFKMDLGNIEHRKAFLSGNVPQDAKQL